MKIAVASLVSQARKKACPAPGKMPIDQRDRREAEQHERDDLGEDHRQRQEAEQRDRAERADEHDHREREALEGAAGLLDVDRGRVGLVDLVRLGDTAGGADQDGISPLRSASPRPRAPSDPAGWRRKRVGVAAVAGPVWP